MQEKYSLDTLLENLEDDFLAYFIEFPADDTTLNSVFENDSTNSLMYLLSDLTKKQRDCLYYRYGFDGNEQRSCSEVAEIMGCHRSSVAKIEAKALAIIRNKVAEKEYIFDDFFVN